LQKCSDYKASKVKTFVRTEPPDTQVTKSVIALLLHYGWNKFTIVTESAWSTVARSLEQQAANNNLTVNHYRTVEDRHTCCEERLPCCQVSVWFQLIQETKNMTRSQFTFFTFALVREMRSPELSIVADRKAAIKFKSLNFDYDSTIVSWDLVSSISK